MTSPPTTTPLDLETVTAQLEDARVKLAERDQQLLLAASNLKAANEKLSSLVDSDAADRVVARVLARYAPFVAAVSVLLSVLTAVFGWGMFKYAAASVFSEERALFEKQAQRAADAADKAGARDALLEERGAALSARAAEATRAVDTLKDQARDLESELFSVKGDVERATADNATDIATLEYRVQKLTSTLGDSPEKKAIDSSVQKAAQARAEREGHAQLTVHILYKSNRAKALLIQTKLAEAGYETKLLVTDFSELHSDAQLPAGTVTVSAPSLVDATAIAKVVDQTAASARESKQLPPKTIEIHVF